MMKFVVGALFALLSTCAYAQSGEISDRDIARLEKKYEHISQDLQQRSLRFLDRLRAKDSVVLSLRNKLLSAANPAAISQMKEYFPGLDSMQTALKFLSTSHLPASSLQSLQHLNLRVISLQDQLQQANNIQSYFQDKLQQWQAAPQKLFKQLYYYKGQVQQYKDMLHDPDKLTSKFLGFVRDRSDFQAFFSKNSYLSTLFRLPGNSVEGTGEPLPGLQTRAQVAAMVEERLGPGASFTSAVNSSAMNGQAAGGDANPLAGSMQQAREQMDRLKEKVAQWGGGSDANMPEFKPNPYHSKTFFQRIQLGFDLQSQSSTYLIPAISTLGLSAGYLLNSRSIIGIGAAYKLGWGQPFEHIAFSSQGVALRSFVNWRMKGSWWIAGGYEANYYNAFNRLSQLPSITAWQSSALIGVMKAYKAGRRAGNVQLLFDALYRQHLPQSQPVVFRVGYSFH